MKLFSLILPILVGSFSGVAATNSDAGFPATAISFDCSFFHAATQAPQKNDTAELDAVLKKMDAVSATFRTAQAEFEWDIYQRVIDEIAEVDKGSIYYRRAGKEVEMMAEVKKSGTSASELKPDEKYVLFSGGKIRLYQKRIDQVTEFDLGKNRSDFEAYVVLGFGGSGQDLLKAFDVTYVGPEKIDGIATAKLRLIPKSDKVRNMYKEIYLWIDLERGISVQQQLITPQGDYRLAKYSNIQVNGRKIPDDVFKLKTTSKTQTIVPKG